LPSGRTIYLKKASDEVVSCCRCAEALINFPAQMDCPWCGCGWLFTCVTCRKAFTFAVGTETSEPLDSIGRRSLVSTLGHEPTAEELNEWIEAMTELLADVEVGRRYVYLDGLFLPADAEQVKFDGWAAHHEFAHLPQVQALNDPRVLEQTIGDRVYWEKHRIDEMS
jgi:hypothetical protein